MEQNRNTLAYTAGIIDGEGSISILRLKSKSCKRGYTLQLRVEVCNTKEWLPQWLKMQYGGTVNIMRKQQQGKQFNNAWQWTLIANRATKFLELIFPFLNLKRPQAKLAITFQSHRYAEGRVRNKLSAKQALLEESEKLLLGKMNKRGI